MIIMHKKFISCIEIFQKYDLFSQFALYNMSKTIIIKRAREARTFNRTG